MRHVVIAKWLVFGNGNNYMFQNASNHSGELLWGEWNDVPHAYKKYTDLFFKNQMFKAIPAPREKPQETVEKLTLSGPCLKKSLYIDGLVRSKHNM